MNRTGSALGARVVGCGAGRTVARDLGFIRGIRVYAPLTWGSVTWLDAGSKAAPREGPGSRAKII